MIRNDGYWNVGVSEKKDWSCHGNHLGCGVQGTCGHAAHIIEAALNTERHMRSVIACAIQLLCFVWL